MIIVEGPDGSGKSTLCRRIAEEFGLEVRRYPGLSSTTGPLGTAIVDWWRDQLTANDQQGVYDRCFYISEAIYQPVTRGRPLLLQGPDMASGIARIWEVEPTIVFCLPPWSVSRHIVDAQTEKLQGVNEDDLRKIHWAYWSYYQMWANAMFERVTRYDFTTDSDGEGPIEHIKFLKED